MAGAVDEVDVDDRIATRRPMDRRRTINGACSGSAEGTMASSHAEQTGLMNEISGTDVRGRTGDEPEEKATTALDMWSMGADEREQSVVVRWSRKLIV